MNSLAPSKPIGTETGRRSPRYRPNLHFAPQRNWMNDPNGLVYFAGEYHMFYQYNPFGDQWGHMSWGHAISHDLVTWEELPVAIPEREREMIFSGSIVVDRDNVSGLGNGDEPPMLAFYTGFDAETDIQQQSLAYSHDRGRTFSFYDSNPIIDLGMAHFRDPKVFWHAQSSAWIMVVALSREHKVQIYRSTNLIDWQLISSFGPAGSTAGQWECPDLVSVAFEDDPSQSAWVLKVDVDKDFVGGGSGAQYFVGQFDGFTFAVDAGCNPNGDVIDFGPDFYAAVTWADLPADQPGPVWVGWMSNHQTGRFYPTEPWRGAQSLPRTMFLFEEAGALRLGQKPVQSVFDAFDESELQRGADIPISLRQASTSGSFHATAAFPSAEPHANVLVVEAGNAPLASLSHAPGQGLIFERHDHGLLDTVSLAFRTVVPWQQAAGAYVDVFFDGCLLELFVDGGKRVFSCCIFPDDPNDVGIRFTAGVDS